jgi:hypothetical protein
MPGTDGFEFAQQAKLIRPRLKVLYTTGYVDQAAARGDVRYGKVLPKKVKISMITTHAKL